MQPNVLLENQPDWFAAVAFPSANLRPLVGLAALATRDDVFEMASMGSLRSLVTESQRNGAAASLVEAAWRVLRTTWPDMWSESRFLVRSIELRTVDTNVLSSGTSSEKPHVVTLAVDLRMPASVVAEALVHETAHLKLHLLEQLVSLAETSPARYQHPWRADMRPARGVLVACHAFAAVHRYWTLLAQMESPARALAFREATRVSSEIRDGIRRLSTVGELTDAGRRIASLLRAEVANTTDRLRSLEVRDVDSRGDLK